jgi:dUTP pyrophosphatase
MGNYNELQEKMNQRIMDITNPNVDYTTEDFENEFSSDIITDPNIFKLTFNFVNKSNNQDPEYATKGSSGFDLRANLTETMTIQPGEYKLIKTGLYFSIPENFEIQIRSRSGLAYKNGICVLNSPGTIDADYTGEIGVLLINHGKEDFIINNGDRIAQAVIASVIGKNFVNLNKVETIDTNTERGSGGFGSTGIL